MTVTKTQLWKALRDRKDPREVYSDVSENTCQWVARESLALEFAFGVVMAELMKEHDRILAGLPEDASRLAVVYAFEASNADTDWLLLLHDEKWDDLDWEIWRHLKPMGLRTQS